MIHESITVSAPGKIILLGEHANVYGKPAIISAVNKRCFVRIAPRSDTLVQITSENFCLTKALSLEDVFQKARNANQEWKTFTKTNDIKILKSLTINELDYALIAIGESLEFFKTRSLSGLSLSISSDIPVGCGMGSSAAIAVAIAAGVSLFFTQTLSKEKISALAHKIEQKKHGFPSGGDTSISTFGGTIWFEKKKIQQVSLKISKNFFLINTGKPVESTGEMVTYVKSQISKRKSQVETIFDEQGGLVHDLMKAMQNKDSDSMTRIIREGERNLETLGVVSPYVQKIVINIERAGGAAKICGGGGIKKATGMLLVYANNQQEVKKIAQKYSLPLEQVKLSEEGVRMELGIKN